MYKNYKQHTELTQSQEGTIMLLGRDLSVLRRYRQCLPSWLLGDSVMFVLFPSLSTIFVCLNCSLIHGCIVGKMRTGKRKNVRGRKGGRDVGGRKQSGGRRGHSRADGKRAGLALCTGSGVTEFGFHTFSSSMTLGNLQKPSMNYILILEQDNHHTYLDRSLWWWNKEAPVRRWAEFLSYLKYVLQVFLSFRSPCKS